MKNMSLVSGFFDFLRSMDPRVFQERDVGLDIYLSGPWGILPAAIAVALATVFLLAIFQVVPRRSRSVPIILVLGLLAAGIGLGGTYLQYRAQAQADGPPPRILTEGRGIRAGAKPGHTEALLALPLLLGGAALAMGVAGALFLLVLGGPGAGRGKKKAPATERARAL